jgi:hypothetical protein
MSSANLKDIEMEVFGEQDKDCDYECNGPTEQRCLKEE